jgi:hypothetical protein
MLHQLQQPEVYDPPHLSNVYTFRCVSTVQSYLVVCPTNWTSKERLSENKQGLPHLKQNLFLCGLRGYFHSQTLGWTHWIKWTSHLESNNWPLTKTAKCVFYEPNRRNNSLLSLKLIIKPWHWNKRGPIGKKRVYQLRNPQPLFWRVHRYKAIQLKLRFEPRGK